MKSLIFMLSLFGLCSSAHAWDCNYWYQSTTPGAECYRPPGGALGNLQNIATATQQQIQTESQKQTQTQAQNSKSVAKGGNAQVGPVNASAGAHSGAAITTSNVDSGNTTYKESVNPVQPAMMIIQGCQVQGQVGGSNTRAAGMLGIGFTPQSCYDYMQAQAYLAIGARQSACEILNHTEAARRAVKNGASLPPCDEVAIPAPVAAVVPPTSPYVTQEELQAVVKRGLVK